MAEFGTFDPANGRLDELPDGTKVGFPSDALDGNDRLYTVQHRHDFDNPLFTCSCGRTAEEERRGLATHPGKPTTERLWELRRRLYVMRMATS